MIARYTHERHSTKGIKIVSWRIKMNIQWNKKFEMRQQLCLTCIWINFQRLYIQKISNIFYALPSLVAHCAHSSRQWMCMWVCVWIRNEMNCDIVIYYRFVMNPKCIANEYFTLYIADCFELIVKMFTRAGSLAARNWNKFCNFLNWKIILMFFLIAMHWIAMSRV